MGDALSSCCKTTSSARDDEQGSPCKSSEAHEAVNDSCEKERMEKMKVSAVSRRRKGVAAESVATGDIKDYKKPVYPKDKAAMGRIRDVLKQDKNMQVLLGHLDEASMQDIVNAFRERAAPAGEALIRQGGEGDCLYIINEGEVDIFVARPGPNGELVSGDVGSKVATLGPGKLFGELALLYTSPRAATAIVRSANCRLWQLDREPFKMLMAQKNQLQAELYEGWLSEVDILKPLNRYELSRLSDLLQSELFDAGEVIIQQGESGSKFYILEDGTCSAFLQGFNGEKEVKEYSKQGQYFGEIALLNDEPRKATVRATGEGASVLSISKEDFTSVLGPIQDILRKHIDKYPHYAEFLKG